VATTDPSTRQLPATPMPPPVKPRPASPARVKSTAAPKAASATAPKPVVAPAAKPHGEGTLLLASSPWCNVRVDGVDKGPTPLSLKLPAGRHTVLLSNPEFHITRTLTVNVEANETVRKRLDFAQ
jgi:hypothetical protein